MLVIPRGQVHLQLGLKIVLRWDILHNFVDQRGLSLHHFGGTYFSARISLRGDGNTVTSRVQSIANSDSVFSILDSSACSPPLGFTLGDKPESARGDQFSLEANRSRNAGLLSRTATANEQ